MRGMRGKQKNKVKEKGEERRREGCRRTMRDEER
jgi:hypothetical protein